MAKNGGGDGGGEAGGGAPLASPAVVLVTALLLFALVIGMELGTAQPTHVLSVLVAIPALVALAFGQALIVGSAVVAVATRWACLPLEPGRLGAAVGTTLAILAVSSVACYVVRRRQREASRLQQVTSVAETAQRAMLRPPPEAVGPLRIAASYRAAARFAQIGGDLYGVADTDFGVRALIADVKGKGLTAVATANVVLGSFHEAAYECTTLGGLSDRLEVSLRRHLVDAEDFVTALLVEIRTDGRMVALSHGHPPPIVLSRDGPTEFALSPGLPLGLRTARSPVGAAPDARLLCPGDTVLMYTDGLTEARNASGAFYPLADRLTGFARAHRTPAAPTELLTWLQTDARDWAGGFAQDDAALLALAWTGQDG
ncbi:PP2C family protein-serine/threonine phosphatase [Streptacidiphilus jiangxiensis]|uniref:Serine phosphatase RsbU, regulator of sigma subunit n=1 Tax=Streptacidiphilus jiangxiensis TaxID=235985 RepID=A0A1H7HEZ4_STRJI|nr:PP2C family protein-serine/threonine phosphatase [Streptacidiphilus jiangxiensis]SEK48851.1 Serine phosphatase RsbU, regulator of sigma subunit [Streptacidiphilus jiangxiensis]